MKPRAALAIVALAVSACATNADGTPQSTRPTTTTSNLPDQVISVPDLDPGEVMLTVAFEGGFVPLDFLLSRAPEHLLTVDGTLYFAAPTPQIFPGPASPNFLRTQLSDGDLVEILQLVEESGLPEVTDKVNRDAAAIVADAPDTVFTYRDGDGAHRFTVYALGIVDASGNAQLDALGRLQALLQELALTAEATPFEPERIQVYLGEGGFLDPDFANVAEWPLPVDPRGFELGKFDLPCGVIDGPDAQTLLAAIDQANSATTWQVDGEELQLVMRPLLPGEVGCS